MVKSTVIINGKSYDAYTGMPIKEELIEKDDVSIESKATTRTRHHQPVHRHRPVAKSKTLNRQFISKPDTKTTPVRERKIKSSVATSSMVTKFAPEEPDAVPVKVKIAPEPVTTTEQFKPVLPASIEQKLAPAALPTEAKPQTSRELKDALIKEQLEKPAAKHQPARRKRRFRAPTIATAACALIILGGYFAYVNMPAISVRVAASRAGVNAKYPEYKPSGYSIDGPVAFAPGQVTINYKSNGNDWKYSVMQQNSNWDSSAVLDNKVLSETNNYQALSQKGLTIYRYGDKASWVNGGVLYTIDGNASLSDDQVLKIVDSI